MKPIVILTIGGLSLAATLTVTHWLSARESEPAPVVTPPVVVEQVRAEQAPPSSTNYSRYHRHNRKWSKEDPRSVVRTGLESK